MKNIKFNFILSSPIRKTTSTYKFNSKEEGLEFLTSHNLDHRIIDIIIW
jgi:hypothetical protein